MSTTPEALQAKLTQLSARFLDRVGGEMAQLRTWIDQAASGNLDVVRQIETLTHRMHGSGAMLYFQEISDRAGELERMAVEFGGAGKVDQPRMIAALESLQEAVDKACANRAPDP